MKEKKKLRHRKKWDKISEMENNEIKAKKSVQVY